MKRQNELKKTRTRVIWDEANLGEIEANKPTRQKIDEPKTPYHAPENDDGLVPSIPHNGASLDDAAHAEAVRNALSRLVASSSEWSREGGDCSSGDEAEDMEYDREACPNPTPRISNPTCPESPCQFILLMGAALVLKSLDDCIMTNSGNSKNCAERFL